MRSQRAAHVYRSRTVLCSDFGFSQRCEPSAIEPIAEALTHHTILSIASVAPLRSQKYLDS
jgi:hypothetical protein